MKIEQLLGYWVLEDRTESPDQENTLSIGNRTYSAKESTIEILVFKNEGKCFQLGINPTPVLEEDNDKFGITQFMPGTYNYETKTIRILENGSMKISEGKLVVKERADDYQCDEIWNKLTDDHEDLIKFLDQMKNI
ncbi:MAG: hypothetical protein U9N85_03360 [Bacteroidota bacterium]|nr:hypothetical protein [Bacteroidota bacterium]